MPHKNEKNRKAVNKIAGKVPAPLGFTKMIGKVTKKVKKVSKGRKK